MHIFIRKRQLNMLRAQCAAWNLIFPLAESLTRKYRDIAVELSRFSSFPFRERGAGQQALTPSEILTGSHP